MVSDVACIRGNSPLGEAPCCQVKEYKVDIVTNFHGETCLSSLSPEQLAQDQIYVFPMEKQSNDRIK